MNVAELINELNKYKGDLEVNVQYSYYDCPGHGEGEHCYCSPTIKRETDLSVQETKANEQGKRVLKKPILLIRTDY